MATYSIEFEAAAALRAMQEYPKQTQRATVRALNRALTSGAATLARLVATDMGIKVGDAKAAIRVQKATAGRLEIRLAASLKRLPLIKFAAKGPTPSRGKGRGVSYKIGTGGRQRIADAFIATMPSGHVGVYKRAGTRRLPIVELFGPSIGRVFDNHRAAGIAQMREVFATNLTHELKFAATEKTGA